MRTALELEAGIRPADVENTRSFGASSRSSRSNVLELSVHVSCRASANCSQSHRQAGVVTETSRISALAQLLHQSSNPSRSSIHQQASLPISSRFRRSYQTGHSAVSRSLLAKCTFRAILTHLWKFMLIPPIQTPIFVRLTVLVTHALARVNLPGSRPYNGAGKEGQRDVERYKQVSAAQYGFSAKQRRRRSWW